MLAGTSRFRKKTFERQLAKSAICAGIRTLLKRGGSKRTRSRRSISRAGSAPISTCIARPNRLFPPNCSGRARHRQRRQTGAAMMLLESSLQRRMAGRIETAEIVDLSTDAYFMQQYIDGMYF
jgi:uncharacterized 2Fe-2S/4Fe-4S cluster protein (DUF4445 family)